MESKTITIYYDDNTLDVMDKMESILSQFGITMIIISDEDAEHITYEITKK